MSIDQVFIIKKLQDLDIMYVAYSQATRMPFATCDKETFNDQAWIFSDEKTIQEFAKEYTEKKIPLMGVKVPRDQAPTFYMNLYSMGINEIIFSTDGQSFTLPLTQIVKIPDYNKIPVQKRPLINQSLQMSVVYFLQELRRPGLKEVDKKHLRELEEEVSANLAKSEFIMPVDINEEKDVKDPKRYLLPYLKNKEGKCYQPVFSDTSELLKHSSRFKEDGKKHEFMKLKFKQLVSYMVPSSDGFMLNPDGYALALNKEQMDIIIKYYCKPDKKSKNELKKDVKEDKTEE